MYLEDRIPNSFSGRAMIRYGNNPCVSTYLAVKHSSQLWSSAGWQCRPGLLNPVHEIHKPRICDVSLLACDKCK